MKTVTRTVAALLAVLLSCTPFTIQAQSELNIAWAEEKIIVSWSAPNAVLEEADTLTGPWRVVEGAASPHQMDPRQAQTFYRLRYIGPPPNVRMQDLAPHPAVIDAVRAFQEQDPDASFGYFNGHVDSFATTPKPAVPSYAESVLRALNLSTQPRLPLKLREPISEAVTPKLARDLDGDFDIALPILRETELGQPLVTEGNPDTEDAHPGGEFPIEEPRTQPPVAPQRLLEWERPSEEVLRLERMAAAPILRNFLELHRAVFRVGPNELELALHPVDYQAGAFFRKAVYEQFYSAEEKLLYGRTLVHFDVNWNVISISRMITTPEKLRVPEVDPRAVTEAAAIEIAARSAPYRECFGRPAEVLHAERCVDPVRRQRVWSVELQSEDGECHWRTIIDAATGEVLNVSDQLDLAYTDAKVNRWYYPGGDQMQPKQTVSTGVYTRNDRRLEHDFFYMMNDHRCDGFPETTCTETSFTSLWCSFAHGTYSGNSQVRATRRTSRDWDKFYPGGASETFGETHAYFWARSFSQWLKPSLDALGVLPGSASNYKRVLIIANACRSGSVHNSSYKVTTESNKGEGGPVIRLAHRNPANASNHNAACQGGGCFDNPSNLAHELNHFFLKAYYGVGSDLDCGAGNQLKFTHEGILGTAVPHAYWHYYYGVGYNPSSTDKLYFSHSTVGRVHTSNATLMTVNDYLCTNFTGDPYSAGRVVGQALWKFYHGKKVTGSTLGSIWYPSTDTDFNVLVYWAADLQASSTYKDRYEFANRVMEILDKYSNWSSAAKAEYCKVFEQHSLHWYIKPAYCQ
jgi:hypothetical protein